MQNIGEISAHGYGIVLLDTGLFTQYLKEKKCRAKKLISYFSRNREAFLDSIKAGRFLPFYRISSFEYSIFVSVNESRPRLPADYNEVFRHTGFYLEVGPLGRVCFASFDYLEYHLEAVKQDCTDKEITVPTGPTGTLEKYFPARGFDLGPGIYTFDLMGLERKEKGERESKNYAYAFVFQKNENAPNNNFEKGDDEVFAFDIKSFKERV